MKKMQKIKNRLMQNRKKGFTMVELIIVIALIAALSVGAVVGYQSLSSSAADAIKRQEAAFIVRTLNQYNQYLKETAVAADFIDSVADVTGPRWVGNTINLKLTGKHLLPSLDLTINDLTLTPAEFTLFVTPAAGGAAVVGEPNPKASTTAGVTVRAGKWTMIA